MNYTIVLEVNLFFQSFLIGAALMCVYDIIRAFRRIIVHSSIVSGIEDVIYWICASIVVFLLLYKYNNGVVRGFAIAGVVIGMLLFEALFGRWIIKIVDLLEKPLQKLRKQYKIKKVKAKKKEEERELKKEKLKEERLQKDKVLREIKEKKRLDDKLKQKEKKQKEEKQKEKEQKDKSKAKRKSR